MKKFFLILFCFLFGVLVFFFMRHFGYIHTKNTDNEIVLTKNGFSPSELTIHQGETVTFTTTTDKEFWPASDSHPTHDIYTDFDPKQPIASNKSWSFVFTKAGSFKYHDHLVSNQRGVINVMAAGTSFIPKSDCASKAVSPECWEEQINFTLNNQGLDAAFNLLAKLYSAQPAFASSCHSYTHILGDEAYEMFSAGKDVNLTAKTAYCGQGFYHGFMEALMQNSGNLQEARDFCAHAREKLSGQTSDAEGACYHGIGHGVADGSDPTAWGQESKIIEPALQLCEKAGPTTAFINRCSSGVFNSLAIMYGDPKYKLDFNLDEPFRACKPLDKDYFVKPCYQEMNTIILNSYKGDFAKAAKSIESVEDSNNAFAAMSSLAGYESHYRSDPNYFSTIVSICHSLQGTLPGACVYGYAGGLMEFGSPGEEYINAMQFCGLNSLFASEKDLCFKRVIWLTSVYYPKNRYREVCEFAQEKYKQPCPSES
jgi:plastocyanin